MIGYIVIGLITAIGMMAFLAAMMGSPAQSEEQIAERNRRNDLRKANIAKKQDWLESVKERFQFVTPGTLIDGPGEGRCILAYDEAEKGIRVFGYTMGGDFLVQVDATIPLAKIISLEVVRPMEMKNVKRKQAVGVVKSNKKSPVARGLVGGALLGPAGLVLGAASGASKDIKTEIKEHTVWEKVQMQGDPQLHIGTSDPASPLVKIKPETATQTEEWLYRIRALLSS